MLVPILAAAIALAPLPEGRGGSRLIALPISSEPAGATATVRYRDSHGAEGGFTCTTPCTVLVPRASPMVLDVVKDGQPLAKPPLRWCAHGLTGGADFCPAAIHAVLPVARP